MEEMASEANVEFDTTLESIPEGSEWFGGLLLKEGFERVRDLILHVPHRYEDRTLRSFNGFLVSDRPVSYIVKVTHTRVVRYGKGGCFEAQVRGLPEVAMSHTLTLRWFNMVFMQKVLAVDMVLSVYGKVKAVKGRFMMDHPDFEVLETSDLAQERGDTSAHWVPVYRLKGGLKQKPMREFIQRMVKRVDWPSVPDILPTPTSKGEFYGWSRAQAWQQLHLPDSMETVGKATGYLGLEEMYVLQAQVFLRRQSIKHKPGYVMPRSEEMLIKFFGVLPFELTGAQKKALDEILADMAQAQPMNRLLHGDVGSGKTAVALSAMVNAAAHGKQAVLMAPTQILAEQHYLSAKRWLEPMGIPVSLVTADRQEKGGNPDLFHVPSQSETSLGEVIVGTHALLYDEERLRNVAFVVIDEQHKFGVEQRSKLIERELTPDVLVMTATPIPRTLTLTVYGDLDVSTLEYRPAARGEIRTQIKTKKQLKEVTEFLKDQLSQGRQCYGVYPLIEESEKMDITSAKQGFEDWQKRLKPYPTELLHGKMSGAEKEQIMERFRSGKTSVLISTTVIEVGVDVPNATVMMIHHADRFGLAQLHQLRGRIGRGIHDSHCLLWIDEKDEEARQRLRIMEETHDGFKIAEEDLQRRGPGDVLGQAQSGKAPLKFCTSLPDLRVIQLARKLAERTLTQDPEMLDPSNQPLKNLLARAQGSVHASRQ